MYKGIKSRISFIMIFCSVFHVVMGSNRGKISLLLILIVPNDIEQFFIENGVSQLTTTTRDIAKILAFLKIIKYRLYKIFQWWNA